MTETTTATRASRPDPATALDEQAPDNLPHLKTRTGLFVAFLLYTSAAAALLFHRGFLTGHSYLGHGTDPSLYIWMFRFLPDAIVHLHNPLILAPAWAPAGLNITEATTTPALALLAWPITAVAGPVVGFNVVSMAAPCLGATSAFLFASAFTRRWSAAFVAGWLFGFSTYVFAALLGHLQVDFVAFVPLAFLAAVQRSRERIGPRAYVAWLVTVLTAQFLTSLETFVTMAMFLALFAAVAEAGRPGGIRRLGRLSTDNLLVGLIIAGALTGLVVSPFIAAFFKDYGRIPQRLQDGGYWSLDLFDLIVPTPVTWLGGRLALPAARLFTGNWSEDLGYIGLPLFAIVVVACWRLRRDRPAWPLLALFIAGLVCTLGPRLHVFGRSTFSLPWTYIGRLPLLGNAEPGRLMVFVLLAIAGLAALWVERRANGRGAATLVLAGAVAFTLPATRVNTRGWWNRPVPKPALFTSGQYRRIIPAHATVLFLPLSPGNGEAMFWQTEADGYFRMANGYGNFVPPDLAIWPAVQMLDDGRPGPGFAAQFDRFAKTTAIARVIVPHSEMAVWAPELRKAGWRGMTVGRLTVFAWPAALRAAQRPSSGLTARMAFDRHHLAALRHALACLLRRHAGRIDPGTAVAAHCLDPFFGPSPDQPHSNWDRMQGWLGRFGGDVAIGLNTIGPVAARLANTAGPAAQRVYYPYPRRYRPGRKAPARGEFIEVLAPAAVAATGAKPPPASDQTTQ